MKNNLLENYLNTVDHTLSVLPTTHRENEQRELRSHLEEMIANRVLSGESEAEATAGALQQFGNAKKVGLGLRTAYFRSAWRTTPAGTLLVALGIQFAALHLEGWYAQCFLNATHISNYAAMGGYLLLFILCGAAVGAVTALGASLHRALAATTLMQIFAVGLLCSGIIASGAHFLGVNAGGFIRFQLPNEAVTIGILPFQQAIALVSGWIAALCVRQHRRQNMVVH